MRVSPSMSMKNMPSLYFMLGRVVRGRCDGRWAGLWAGVWEGVWAGVWARVWVNKLHAWPSISMMNMFSLYLAAWPEVCQRFMLYMFGVTTSSYLGGDG